MATRPFVWPDAASLFEAISKRAARKAVRTAIWYARVPCFFVLTGIDILMVYFILPETAMRVWFEKDVPGRVPPKANPRKAGR